jgi:hypothetical protein
MSSQGEFKHASRAVGRARASRLTRLLALALSVLGASLAFSVGSAWAAPPRSVSYYEYGVNGSLAGLDSRLYRQGFRAGQRGISKQVVFVVFGAPRQSGSGFGQQLFGYRAPIISFTRALQAIKRFSDGYHNGWQTPKTGSITIAWGTSNGRIPTTWSNATVDAAAEAFANNVRSLRNYQIAQAYNRQHVAAAMDIEQDVGSGNWNDYPITKRFIDAYRGVGSAPYFINFGSDEIGPFQTPQPGFGAWTVAGVVYVSRSSRSSACPQIYNQNRISEWTATQAYADGHGAPIYFFCVMAQGRATATNFGGRDAWDRFHDALTNVNGVNYVLPGRSYLGPRATIIRCATTAGVTTCGI